MRTKFTRLGRDFFAQPTLDVARQLLGSRLVRVEQHEGQTRRIAGIIIETEAYCGEEDLGCHAKAGRTPRTEVMYGPPGHAYVYFTYGMHWLFNFVTRPEGQPEAVLLRAVHPTEGLDIVAERRGHQPARLWTDGPAKVTQAFGIDGQHNRLDLAAPEAIIFVEPGEPVPDEWVTTGPRVGFFTVPEPWKSKPWRFLAHLPVIEASRTLLEETHEPA